MIIVLGLILFETINAGFFQKVTVKTVDRYDLLNGEVKYKVEEFDTEICIKLNIPLLGIHDDSLQFKCQDKDTLKVHLYRGSSCSGSEYPVSPGTIEKKYLPYFFFAGSVSDFDCNGLTKIQGILLIIGIIIFIIIIICVIICCKKKQNSVYYVYGNNPQRPPMQVYVPPTTQQMPTQPNTIQMYAAPTPQTTYNSEGVVPQIVPQTNHVQFQQTPSQIYPTQQTPQTYQSQTHY